MFTLQLTPFVHRIREQIVPEELKPLLQIIQLKPLAAPNGRLCNGVVLSDGLHYARALFHPRLQCSLEMINSVVKVVSYNIILLPSNRVLLTVSHVELVAKLPHVLGTPQAISDDENLNFSSLASDLQQLLPSVSSHEKLCDITFIIEGQAIHAHKAILVARSSYFRALLLNGMQESSRGGVDEIHINDFNYEVFRCMLCWIYTDNVILPAEKTDTTKVDLMNSNLFSLWSAANFFCLGNLVASLETIIAQHLTPDNLCPFWNLVSRLDSKNLNFICETYFISNLEKIAETESYLKLEKDLVIKIFYANTKTDPKNNVHPIFQLRKIPTALSVQAVTRWLTANSPGFSQSNLAEFGKNRARNAAMEVQ